MNCDRMYVGVVVIPAQSTASNSNGPGAQKVPGSRPAQRRRPQREDWLCPAASPCGRMRNMNMEHGKRGGPLHGSKKVHIHSVKHGSMCRREADT